MKTEEHERGQGQFNTESPDAKMSEIDDKESEVDKREHSVICEREKHEIEKREPKALYRPHELGDRGKEFPKIQLPSPTMDKVLDSRNSHSDTSDNDSRIESPERSKSPASPAVTRHMGSSHSFLSKDFSSPPNVTIVQPSPSHSMFPFFYPYSSSSSGLHPYQLNPMLLPGNPSLPPGLQLPFIPSSRHSEMGHLSPSHSHALSTLNQLTLQNHMLSQSYSSLSSELSGNSSVSPTQNTTVGPIFPSRTSPRYSPYSLQSSKSFVQSTSPGSGNGSRNEQEAVGISRPSPIRPRSPLTHQIPFSSLQNSTNPNNELRHMERMLNVLDRKRLDAQERERAMSDVH